MKTLLLLSTLTLTAQMTPEQIADVTEQDKHGCRRHCEDPHGDHVPEPGTWALIGAGLAAIAWRRRKI